MRIIKTITDVDIGSEIPVPEKFKERKATRCVVFDKDSKIALVYAAANNYHKLPGGGLEEGEEIENGLRRELVEEIGCEVENIRDLGIIEEYRNMIGLHQMSYCFISNVKSLGTPQLDPNEVIEGYQTKWVNIDDALFILDKELGIDHYDGKFMLMRDIAIIQEAKNFLVA